MHGGEKRYELNLLGLPCPYPEVLTIHKTRELLSKDILEIILNSPPSVGIIRDISAKNQFSVLSTEEIGKNVWKIVIEKL
ncbi:MAG: sulfurtransferase TusA family protein [Candidatus Thermoplasmatota archaeon]|jgi:TusA-related sulfurtransferase|nr:sulfurtransferase TusA family protein [Candidatus Thermoplasmatota archaeon]MDA8142980.1 sulfurtransferase TusA family protein [Thermoplasmatales archaeon]